MIAANGSTSFQNWKGRRLRAVLVPGWLKVKPGKPVLPEEETPPGGVGKEKGLPEEEAPPGGVGKEKGLPEEEAPPGGVGKEKGLPEEEAPPGSVGKEKGLPEDGAEGLKPDDGAEPIEKPPEPERCPPKGTPCGFPDESKPPEAEGKL